MKKKDIGKGATANYEARHPQGQDEFQFDRLVSHQELDEITPSKAMWQGQRDSENISIDKWDVGAKPVATLEAIL